ncbi:hypothetical protein [Staphylococcus epidermidis]|nr:hypothetical protein [Staphylococcus epidermidis]
MLISDNGSTDIQNQVKRLIQQNAKKNILPIINTNNYSEIESII